ncbi:phytoene synthase [Sphingomonas sp. OV641]|uniref:squalene/phytoene synthase family protein n=1 Tax=Sphingomonas sp. OV641 TaxID=1881068 RepID=UPI0008B9EFF4|nr:squalene/phytoene synthase family protein [Sphingomonas sp. OV641]SEI91059.1 phytoene synthase [Sphingomonas sp. OV641]
MVNDTDTFGIDPAAGHPERALALGYAPEAVRPAISALFALDATLAKLAIGTRDAMVAQLRLTWWHEALLALGQSEPPAQPILRTLAAARVDGAALARMEIGWERLLQTPDEEALIAFGEERGMLFTEAARLAGAADDATAAGAGWALADLSRLTVDTDLSARAAALARPLVQQASAQRWSPAGRFIGALLHVAAADLAGERPVGAPGRVLRLAWHRLSGR